MAVSPPFAISETLPANSDLISIFPGQENPYRDTVKSWLTFISDPTTGLLKPAAFPAFVNSWVVQALDVSSDAVITFKDNLGVVHSKVLWDRTNDQLSLVAYQTDGVTVRTRLNLKGGTAVADLAAGALQVGGVAVVLTNYAGSLTGLVGTGALNAGSITSGFGAINIGTNTLAAGITTIKNGVNATSTGQPTGTFAATVYHATNAPGMNGLLVKNNWSAVDSTIFEAGTDIVGGAYISRFKVDGSGNIIVNGSATIGGSISSSSNVFANTSAGTLNLRPSGPGSATGQMTITAAGNVTAAGDITASSDRRLKKSISGLNHQWASDMVKEVTPVTFLRKKNDQRGIGFIAQDVQGYAPEIVHADDHGMLSLAYPNMVAILWAVVQDLQQKVAALEAK